MIYLFLFIGALFSSVIHNHADHINCTWVSNLNRVIDKKDSQFVAGWLALKYDRQKLAVYTYEISNYSNFLIPGSEVHFSGNVVDRRSQYEATINFPLDLEGVALLKENKDGTGALAQCEIDLAKAAHYSRNALPSNTASTILDEADTCIQAKLCALLGKIQIDDIERAENSEHEFGSMSALYRDFREKFPNLHFPHPKQELVSLHDTLNLMTDLWLVTVITRITDDGKIDLPWVDDQLNKDSWNPLKWGHLTMEKGYLANLRNITRAHDVYIASSDVEFLIKAEYELIDAQLHYDEFMFQQGLVNVTGQCDFYVDELGFKFEARVKYDNEGCRAELSDMGFKSGNVHFQLIPSSSFYDKFTSSLLASDLTESHARRFVVYIEKQLRFAVATELSKFDCEKLRPYR